MTRRLPDLDNRRITACWPPDPAQGWQREGTASYSHERWVLNTRQHVRLALDRTKVYGRWTAWTIFATSATRPREPSPWTLTATGRRGVWESMQLAVDLAAGIDQRSNRYVRAAIAKRRPAR